MKILFLDVDGVLNSRSTTDFRNNLYPVDPYMAFLVGKIKLDTGCEVVLSSSWRYHQAGYDNINDRVVTLLDKTPTSGLVDYNDKPRGHEIQAWLDRHSEVTRYAILDDDTDMLDEQLPNFFKTTFQYGLTDEIAQAVTKHLSQE